MIHICDQKYPDDAVAYNSIFSEYPFELDHFQKWAIQAIEEDYHVVVTAHTGSGKSILCDHAIKKYCQRLRKKVVYTAPIKSLSNQKFHEYTQKYPDVSFGILTGDIKFNPQADCIIMTTEILRNALFRAADAGTSTGDGGVADTFELDINDLACVVFDEIHYINDRDRGKVWEETIIKLPKDVQIIGLSATIDRPETFAKWIADTKGVDVWLTSTDIRVVPLTHYSYFKVPDSVLKIPKGKKGTNEQKGKTPKTGTTDDPQLLTDLQQMDNQICVIKRADTARDTTTTHDTTTVFNNDAVNRLHRVSRKLENLQIRSNAKFVLNQVCENLHIEQMLPAICFVFSRKKVIEYANCIEHQLFKGDEQHLRSKVEQECKQILMKLPNYKEYLELPEFHELVRLLQKGIAVHHSGILPVLREMVELLFSKGYIKMLFATETFAVGINMPTKTVLFTSLEKYDGTDFRYLLSHEYTQMAGRAGRRGLDKVGHVIHLNNLFEVPLLHDYQTILNGQPQKLRSKFQIDFSLLLRVFAATSTGTSDSPEDQLSVFISQSMIGREIEIEHQILEQSIQKLESQLNELREILSKSGTSVESIEKYKQLALDSTYSNHKARIRLINQMDQMIEECPTLQKDADVHTKITTLESELEQRQVELINLSNYIRDTIEIVRHELFENGFLNGLNGTGLTRKGQIASQLQELNCLVFAEIFEQGLLDSMSAIDLVILLSSFTDIRVDEDHKQYSSSFDIVGDILFEIAAQMDYYYDLEQKTGLYIDESRYTILYDLHDDMCDWCNAQSEADCKNVITSLAQKGIFIGEFVKAVLKINNVAHELDKICDLLDLVDLKHKLSQIPELTLKFVATNQSLYI